MIIKYSCLTFVYIGALIKDAQWIHTGLLFHLSNSTGLLWMDGDLCVGLDWIILGCHCPLSNVPGCLLPISWSWIPSGSGLEFCLFSPSLLSRASVLCLLNKFSTSIGFFDIYIFFPNFFCKFFFCRKSYLLFRVGIENEFPFVVQNQFPLQETSKNLICSGIML